VRPQNPAAGGPNSLQAENLGTQLDHVELHSRCIAADMANYHLQVEVTLRSKFARQRLQIND
jgi:hypothetical protein